MGIVVQFMNQVSDISVTPTGTTGTVTDQSGGHVTYTLDHVETTSAVTVAIVGTNVTNEICRAGSWVTPPAPPNTSQWPRQILSGTTFYFNKMYGYEQSGPMNAYFCWRIGLLRYNPGGGDVHTDYNWLDLSNGWQTSTTEIGTVSGSQDQYGGKSEGTGGSDNIYVNTTRDLLVNDRIMIEWGIKITNASTNSVYFEFGGKGDEYDNPVSSVNISFGSECVLPINFTEEYQDFWGAHAEITSPIGSSIAFSEYSNLMNWTSGYWSDAQRYVVRRGGQIVSQLWTKMDEDFFYMCSNYIVDGCIQDSDHAYVYFCGSQNWKTATTPDYDDYMFSMDINGKESQTHNPTDWVQGGAETGPKLCRGAQRADRTPTSYTNTFPFGWQPATWHAGTTHTPRGAEFRAIDLDAVDSDVFTGSDGTSLSTYNVKWQSYYYTGGTAEINTNRVRGITSQTNEGGYISTGSTGLVDCAVEVDWVVVAVNNSWNGIMMRVDTATTTHYEFRFNCGSGITNNVEINRIVNGVSTNLRQSTVTGITTETIRVRALCHGTQTKIYFNGRTIAEYNDSTNGISTGDFCGIFLTNANNAFDNYNYAQPTLHVTEFWQEGVDFRLVSRTSGADTPPDPNTDDVSTVGKCAMVNFKIRKRKINGWNGYNPSGFMVNMQCDVQAAGSTFFPGALGARLDKPGWAYPGIDYNIGDNKTAANVAAASDLSIQPLMGAHVMDGTRYKFYIGDLK